MTQDEIIEITRQAELDWQQGWTLDDDQPNRFEAFAKLVAVKVKERYMQLFLDPENQPTQFGTATQEYREQEIKEVRDLLTALAHYVRTQHLYGMEVQKMLDQEQAIRTRGQQ